MKRAFKIKADVGANASQSQEARTHKERGVGGGYQDWDTKLGEERTFRDGLTEEYLVSTDSQV